MSANRSSSPPIRKQFNHSRLCLCVYLCWLVGADHIHLAEVVCVQSERFVSLLYISVSQVLRHILTHLPHTHIFATCSSLDFAPYLAIFCIAIFFRAYFDTQFQVNQTVEFVCCNCTFNWSIHDDVLMTNYCYFMIAALWFAFYYLNYFGSLSLFPPHFLFVCSFSLL